MGGCVFEDVGDNGEEGDGCEDEHDGDQDGLYGGVVHGVSFLAVYNCMVIVSILYNSYMPGLFLKYWMQACHFFVLRWARVCLHGGR